MVSEDTTAMRSRVFIAGVVGAAEEVVRIRDGEAAGADLGIGISIWPKLVLLLVSLPWLLMRWAGVEKEVEQTKIGDVSFADSLVFDRS